MIAGRDKEGRKIYCIRGKWYRFTGKGITRHLPKTGMEALLLACKVAIAAFYGFVLLYWPLMPYLQEAFRG